MVMYLNKANRVLGVYPASVGGITSSIVDLRLILSIALKTLATSVVLCHNHPSGSLTPSKQDIDLTLKIKEAAKYFDIVVQDHLIITFEQKYFSFADDGLI
jgi:DNA repair protein RadC